MEKKKLCLIGCGNIGGYHLGHFMQYGDLIEMVGFCDLVHKRAEEFAKKAGQGRTYWDFREMYDKEQPDMVFICLPPTVHGEIEKETIKRGIHFFVEKPVALHMEIAKEIRDLAAQRRLITASGFQCRYSNLVEPNRTFIRENEVPYICCNRFGGIPSAEWWSDKAKSGGQLVEQTVHQCDLLRYFCGEVDSVCSMGGRGFVRGEVGYDTDDLSVTIVRFKNGTMATIGTGCYVKNGNAFDSKITFSARDKRADLRILSTLDIYGEQPFAATEQSGFVVSGDGGVAAAGDGKVRYTQEGDAGLICDRTFIEAVISGDQSMIRSSYADAVKTLAFVLACNLSMELGGAPVRPDAL